MLVDTFFELLRCALWGGTFDRQLSQKEFLQLMVVAEQQTVTGLLFDILSGQQAGVEKQVVLRYANKLSKIHRKNQVTNAELLDFAHLCELNHIDIIVVKGQTIGTLYPNPMLRVSGDIDFLIKDDYQSCKSLIENVLGVTLPEKMLEREVSFKRNGQLYELHNNLIEFGSKRNNKYWKSLMQEAWDNPAYIVVDGAKVRTLPPTINAVYIFLHLFFHLIREGVALRQLCDWAVFLHACHDEIDRAELAQILERLDVVNAFRAFGSILIGDLGLPQTSFPMEVSEKDAEWRTRILRDIFKGGNFGKQNHHSKNSLMFKFETMRIAWRNSRHYYSLAPTEARLLLPRLLKRNLLLMAKGRLR